MKDNNEFERICNELIDLQKRKNADYGGSFSSNVKKYGMLASVIPLSNKINRIESLVMNSDSPHMESLRDSYIDTACYAIMSVIEIDRNEQI